MNCNLIFKEYNLTKALTNRNKWFNQTKSLIMIKTILPQAYNLLTSTHKIQNNPA